MSIPTIGFDSEKLIVSLQFSSEPTWLFCGTNDGVVSLWDVGLPTLPTYDGVNPKQLLKLFPDYGDVYNIAWSGHESNWLLAGTAAGLVSSPFKPLKIVSYIIHT